jgi:hypothetical protein
MRGIPFLPVACLSISLVSAQSLSGPVIGFTFDGPTLAIRAVNGLPGSATLGAAVLSGIEFGSPAPYRTYGVGFKNGQAFLISGLGSSPVSTEPIAGIFGTPEGAVWSADGSHVALFSRSDHWIQTLSGLPSAPVVEPHQDLAPLGGLLCDVAINSAGGQVAIAMCGRQAGVHLSTGGQQFTPLARIENPIALVFSVDGASLYVLDAGARKLAVIQLSDSSVQELTLPELAAPFAIRDGLDASKQPVVYVASRSDRVLGIYSLSAKKMEETFPLNFEPTGFQALGSTTFVIASRVQASDPLWIFSTQPHPAVYFVPAWQAALKGVE